MILKNLSPVIDLKKVHTIYHGIDFSKIDLSRKVMLSEIEKQGRGLVLGNAGRLTAQKGQKHLIEIAKKLKNSGLEFTLFIAGSGDMEEELKGLIDKNQLNDVIIMLGFVEDMDAFMQSIDVFILTSEWEGFGFVLVEAMAREVPVVCFDITSNPEIIKDKETGFLVPYAELDEFTERIKTLSLNSELRQKMGEIGKRRVLKHFAIEDRIKELEACINLN
jgi:glycosyltransferase involved in cell wall biosynthesis